MTGKGWTWLGSDGAVSSTFTKSQNLQHAMQGMVGFRPIGAGGHLFSSITKKWKFGGKNEKVSNNIFSVLKMAIDRFPEIPILIFYNADKFIEASGMPRCIRSSKICETDTMFELYTPT